MQRQKHSQLSGARGLPGWQPFQNWEALAPGDLVEVWSEGTALHYAYVDDLSENGSIVWLVEDGTGSRRLVLRSDPITLYAPKTERVKLAELSA
ncbi:hypothetical protein M1D89_00945 (plasmid) [Arthrobacter sp. D3-18]